ncbi:tRNA (adenine(58)-N(1))-methyltransferase catalytic subunit trmt61a [Phlyctochytrium bullatum]|nr:tRNA (adenine(58)-N(1))-methyltransferase catalytic subunit trmt61a [Phlyctochytrium bullatum]
MSFCSYTTHIAEGDTVIVYMSPNAINSIVVKKGGSLNNRMGYFKHDDMIGLQWGSKVYSQNKKGYLYLLHPTPELWTLVLPHRTQILYLPDIAFITAKLGIQPGSVVVESGTGSASFSHSLARTISPNGKLYTFEFHEQRATAAAEEFRLHKIDHLIKVHHRDVCGEGFGLEDIADAVFLDLPSPWEAVGAAKKALKRGKVGKLCSFSPCIEQVQKTVDTLIEHGFFDVSMFEVLTRPFDIKRHYFAPLVKPAHKKLRENLAKKAGKKASDETAQGDEDEMVQDEPEEETGKASTSGKRKSDDDGPKDTKRPKTESTDANGEDEGGDQESPEKPAEASAECIYISKVSAAKVRGHTSYLVFANVLKMADEGESEGKTNPEEVAAKGDATNGEAVKEVTAEEGTSTKE